MAAPSYPRVRIAARAVLNVGVVIAVLLAAAASVHR